MRADILRHACDENLLTKAMRQGVSVPTGQNPTSQGKDVAYIPFRRIAFTIACALTLSHAAQAQQATSADALSYTQLRATAPGVVTARDIEVGQVVQAAETAFSVAEDGPRDAAFHVYERILFERPQTDHIALSLATDPSVSTTGSIREISPAVDTTTGTVRVKVGIYDVPDRMNLGSAVVGQALLPGTRGVIVPWSALASDAGQPAVWVVDIDTGTTDLRPVRIQAYETGRIILAGGVDAGEAVVVDGTKFLRPGEKVSVIEEAGS